MSSDPFVYTKRITHTHIHRLVNVCVVLVTHTIHNRKTKHYRMCVNTERQP